jgi:uncharacterized cupin superfamily protein/glyoxylase-like metal-dependent hydrolase (beta-lactamase superfamily II)
MQRLAFDDAWMWSAWQPDRGMFFNSYLFVREDGNVAIDPLSLDAETDAAIDRLGGVRAIVLTNRDHERAAGAMRERFGARILAHAAEAPLFSVPIESTFADGEEVFPGAIAIALDGAKTAGEVALSLSAHRAAIVGDALIGAPAGALSLLADEKLGDSQGLLLSLRRLWALRLETLLVCDGAPLWSGSDAALGALLEIHGGISVNRINVDELWRKTSVRGPVRFRCTDAEVGLLIGARKLGYRVARLPPGSAFCPLHDHAVEEEMCFVLEGTPSVRSLRGTIRLRRGDFVAFPTGAVGTHQFVNESDTECELLILGMDSNLEVAYYPDSDKVLVETRSRLLMLAASPTLEYFDGE